jgi:hypothetical protein
MHNIPFLIAISVASIGCKETKSGGGKTPLGTTGLSIELPEHGKVKEDKPGYWTVDGVGQGDTSITVPYERGMPSADSFKSMVREDEIVGDVGGVETLPNGMVIHTVQRTKDGKTQRWEYAYLPTKTGAALCKGWTDHEPNDPSLSLCRKLTVDK